MWCRPEEARCCRCSAPAQGTGPAARPRPAPENPSALSAVSLVLPPEEEEVPGSLHRTPLLEKPRFCPLASEQLPDAEPGAGGALPRGPADNGTSWGRSVLGLPAGEADSAGRPRGARQNHRLVGLGRDLKGSSGPTPKGRAGRFGCSIAAWRGLGRWPQASLPACAELLWPLSFSSGNRPS